MASFGFSADDDAVELTHNESMLVRLDEIRHVVHVIVFVVTVFSSGKDLEDVHDLLVSLSPEDATTTGSDFARVMKAYTALQKE